MATRFGAPRPRQMYETKFRLILGGLICVILVLVGVVVSVALRSDDSTDVASDSTGTAIASTSPTVSILVARVRIEEGTEITPELLDESPVAPDKIPEGSILSNYKNEAIGKFLTSSAPVRPGFPLLKEDLSERRPSGVLSIPPGMRAVTIEAGKRQMVEGWAKPGTRVDVLWSYRDNRDNQQKVATIVRFVKILSVGGITVDAQGNQVPAAGSGGPITVTLLVPERDAKRIELARNMGDLSLSLVGETEIKKSTEDVEAVSIRDILNQPVEVVEESTDGTMWITNSKTGVREKYSLSGGRWKKADEGIGQ